MKRILASRKIILDLLKWDILITSFRVYYASQYYAVIFLDDYLKESIDKVASHSSLPLLVSSISEIFTKEQPLKKKKNMWNCFKNIK